MTCHMLLIAKLQVLQTEFLHIKAAVSDDTGRYVTFGIS